MLNFGACLPNITWMDEDGSLLMGSDMVINSTSIQSTLTSNLQDDAFDNCTCTATNKFGIDSVTALLESELVVYNTS